MIRHASKTAVRAARVQSRFLASTVLLPKTSEQWQEHTLSQLRTEAKRRGLAMGGNKTKLVERLVAHSEVSERPSAPAGAPSLASTPERQRWISSSSHLQAEAPGDKFKPRWARSLDVKLPETPEEVDEGPVIPFLAQKFDSPASESASPPQELPSSAPRVVTVASAATHIGGGPSHAIHEATDAHALESEAGSKSSSGGLGGLLHELGISFNFNFKDSTSSAVNEILQPVASGIATPTIDKDTSNLKDAQRDLNEEEKRGLWVLGGIVIGGLVLGSLGNKKSTAEKENH